MASKTRYKCVSCGYYCDNYDGRGFFGQIALPRLTGESEGGDSMVVCLHCHTVQPLTVGGMIAEVAPSFSTEYGRLCPQCMSDDLRIWDGHTCPKCGGKMPQEGKAEFWT